MKAKKAPAKRVAKAEKPSEKAAAKIDKPVERHEKPVERPEKAPEKLVAKKAAKAPRKAAKATEAKKATAKKAAKVTKAAKKAVAATPTIAPTAPVAPTPVPAVALKRGRQPVNPEADFAQFTHTYRVGAKVPGEVTAFTSHGAVIKVALKDDQRVECYAPTTSLGTPPPARARDVLKRGDQRTFRLVNVDSDRRIAELALA